MSSPRKGGEGIVWACIERDGTVLVESCPRSEELPWEGAREAIRALFAKEPTLGWDVSTSSTSTSSSSSTGSAAADQQNVCDNLTDRKDDRGGEQPLPSSQQTPPTFKGLRFPVYEAKEEGWADQIRIWTFSCAYDANSKHVTKRKAQAFLEKVVMITEYFRESPEWRTGGFRSCQDGFGQILQQRMEEMADPQHLAAVDDALDLSAQIVKSNRSVLNAVRLQETSRCLDESHSSSHSSFYSSSAAASSLSSSHVKQENWNPATSLAGRASFFKLRGGSVLKPLSTPQQPDEPTDSLHQGGPTVPPHRSSLRFVARSVAQRELANRHASSSSSSSNPVPDVSAAVEHRNDERSSHYRSRTDSMEDFLQALEREACMPQRQPSPAEAETTKIPGPAHPSDGDSKLPEKDESGDKAPVATSNEKSPSRSRRRAGGGGAAAASSSAATRAETLAILVVMMLSCLLATLPQSVLKATVLSVPGPAPSARLDEY